jgi:hypothetical protein
MLPNSIVSNLYSTASPRRLLQQYHRKADMNSRLGARQRTIAKCHKPTLRPPSSLRQRLGDVASVLNEQLRNWAERAA